MSTAPSDSNGVTTGHVFNTQVCDIASVAKPPKKRRDIQAAPDIETGHILTGAVHLQQDVAGAHAPPSMPELTTGHALRSAKT